MGRQTAADAPQTRPGETRSPPEQDKPPAPDATYATARNNAEDLTAHHRSYLQHWPNPQRWPGPDPASARTPPPGPPHQPRKPRRPQHFRSPGPHRKQPGNRRTRRADTRHHPGGASNHIRVGDTPQTHVTLERSHGDTNATSMQPDKIDRVRNIRNVEPSAKQRRGR